jgi:TrmH family RNA methyltransferase
MLTRAQEKLILSLHTTAGRRETGLCVVEGQKVIETAGAAIEYLFTPADTDRFDRLVTTVTPQQHAAVARIPRWTFEDIQSRPVIVVLDAVQDPGNVGAILRLCLAFRASLLLVDSCDVSSPKVVRSSVGALFQVPWVTVARAETVELIEQLGGTVFRLEHSVVENADLRSLRRDETAKPLILIAGSEGRGITLDVTAPSLAIAHDPALESLNVSQALAITLHAIYTS